MNQLQLTAVGKHLVASGTQLLLGVFWYYQSVREQSLCEMSKILALEAQPLLA